jgi:hypothetical protein
MHKNVVVYIQEWWQGFDLNDGVAQVSLYRLALGLNASLG